MVEKNWEKKTKHAHIPTLQKKEENRSKNGDTHKTLWNKNKKTNYGKLGIKRGKDWVTLVYYTNQKKNPLLVSLLKLEAAPPIYYFNPHWHTNCFLFFGGKIMENQSRKET